MVLVGISDLDEETAAKYPGVYDYGRCQSRAFMKGMFAFFAGGAAGLTGSYLVRQRYPNFPPLYNVFIVAGGAIVTSYLVASMASKQCQRLWVNTAKQAYPAGTEARQLSPSQADTESTKIHLIPEASSSKSVLGTTKYGDQMG